MAIDIVLLRELQLWIVSMRYVLQLFVKYIDVDTSIELCNG